MQHIFSETSRIYSTLCHITQDFILMLAATRNSSLSSCEVS